MSSEERKHTKWPWQILGYAEGGHLIGALTETEQINIAIVEIPIHDSDIFTKEQSRANAELIASAPTLLESNERMKELLQKALPMLNHYRMHLGDDEDRADTKAADLITAMEQEIKP